LAYSQMNPDPPTRIDLHLRLCVAPGRRNEFLAFLRETIPYYESPGGIEIRLLQDKSDDHRFIELVLYENEQAYERDQERVARDPTMKRHLERWRSLLAEPPQVEVYRLLNP
jgi:quinol monooxygenase YgiN